MNIITRQKTFSEQKGKEKDMKDDIMNNIHKQQTISANKEQQTNIYMDKLPSRFA